VTLREFEVFELVTLNAGTGRSPAACTSRRAWCKKHIGSLITKTGQPDRSTLNEYAVGMLERAVG